MNGRVAKGLRKQADQLEVRGTPEWRRRYRGLKYFYKKVIKFNYKETELPF